MSPDAPRQNSVSVKTNSLVVKTGGRSPIRRSALFRMLAGVFFALIAAECALRPFSSALSNTWRPLTEDDPSEGRAKEIRQYYEGIAASHFSSSHARLTGHPWVKDAATLVLIGDSYVEATHVDDTETLGAKIEVLARRSGHPLNVRQYGWSGAGAATYVAVAPAIAQRWGAAPIVILANHGDLGSEAFVGATRLVIEADRTVHVEVHDELEAVRPQGIVDWILRRSTLAYVLARRMLELRSDSIPVVAVSSAPSQLFSEAAFIRISIRELKRAYSNRLLIVYIPETRIDGTIVDLSDEAAFLSACETLDVACLSERSTLEAAVQSSRLVRGFPNTLPGVGHINALGYSLIAEDVWKRALMARR